MEAQAVRPMPPGSAILIVDDAIGSRAALGDLLRVAGYRVFEAGDADEAIVLLDSRLEIEVLITDVEMPGTLDGLALARRVRRTRPAMQVLVLSGLDVASKVAGEGIACFAKPLAWEALLAVLPPVALVAS